MPEPTTTTPPAASVVDPADNNAQVAAKLAAQDAAGHSTAGTPNEFEVVGSALDRLAEEASKKLQQQQQQTQTPPPEPKDQTPPPESQPQTPEQIEAAK